MGSLMDLENNLRKERNSKILKEASKDQPLTKMKVDFTRVVAKKGSKLSYRVDKSGIYGTGKY